MRQNHYPFLLLLALRVYMQFAPAVELHASLLINLPVLLLLYLYIINNSGLGFIRKALSTFPIYIVPALNMIAVWNVPMINIVYSLFQWISWPLIGLFVVDRLNLNAQKTAFWLFISCFILTSLTTIYGCTLYPNASRALANGDFLETENETANLYRSMNIGNFQFIYTLVLILPIIICAYKYSIIRKLVGYIVVALFLLTIYQSQYTTALLLSSVTFIFLMLPLSKNSKTARNWLIALLFLGVISLPTIAELLQVIAGVVDSEQVSTRFNEMSSSLNGQQLDDSTDLGTRIYLWRLSFKSFINHFLTGVYFITDYKSRYLYIGGHSFILDTMARFGIFGLTILIWMFSTLFKMYIKPYQNKPEYIYIFTSFVLNILLCLVNTASIEIVFVFLIPVFMCFASRKTQAHRL